MGCPPSIQRKFMRKVYDQSERLTALITDLLTISRLEHSDQQIREHQQCDLSQIVTKSCRDHDDSATDKQSP